MRQTQLGLWAGHGRKILIYHNPIGSMYGILTYIWLKFMVHVGKYTIHGWELAIL